nr:zf-BED domain-containing protein [Tanacetum cinerariifolium]
AKVKVIQDAAAVAHAKSSRYGTLSLRIMDAFVKLGHGYAIFADVNMTYSSKSDNDEDDDDETYEFIMNEFPAIQIHNNLSSKSTRTQEALYYILDEKYDAIACDFSPKLKLLLASKSHIVVPVCFIDTFYDEFNRESKMLDLLKIDSDLFSCNTPLRMIFDEFRRLSSMEEDLFTYELGVIEDFHFSSVILIGDRLVKLIDISLEQCGFDKRKPMEDDDDISDLDEYLIPRDAPYYVNEEEEGFKERRIKLLEIPYKKPPTFKSEKFKVIKYSLGAAKEYVSIKEYEYDIWLRTEENVSQVYEKKS